MAILVAVPLLATTFISIRAILWFGTFGIFLFPAFVTAGCLVSMILSLNVDQVLILTIDAVMILVFRLI